MTEQKENTISKQESSIIFGQDTKSIINEELKINTTSGKGIEKEIKTLSGQDDIVKEGKLVI
jgi:hypothetical protein